MKSATWSDLKHDHLFILGAFLVVFSTLMISFNFISSLISQTINSSTHATSQISGRAPHINNSYAQARNSYVTATSVTPTIATAPVATAITVNNTTSDVASNYFYKSPLVKIRPKNNNNWVIDSTMSDSDTIASSEVDSNSLRVAFMNAIAGDKFILKAGDYLVPSEMPNDLEITGNGETKLSFSNVRGIDSMTLNNLKIIFNKYLFFSDIKKVTLNNVHVKGSISLSLSALGLNKISNSTFIGVELVCEGSCDLNMEKTTMAQARSLITLKTFGNVVIRDSDFSNFIDHFINFESASQIEIFDSKIYNGRDAFNSYKNIPFTIEGKSLYFKNLNSVINAYSTGINLNCVYCSTENILSDRKRR